MTQQDQAVLLQSFLFAGEKQLPDLPDSVCICSFRKGNCVYSETEYRRALGIVLSGELIAAVPTDSKAVLSVFRESDSFGVASMFGKREEYISRITAKKDSRVLFLSEEDLRHLFEQNSQYAVHYIAFLSSRICLLNQKIAVFTGKSAGSRVYAYLCSHADESGRFTLNSSMTLLAKTLGIGRTSLYRELDALERSGLLEKQDHSWFVH